MSKMVLVDGNSLMFRAYYATVYSSSGLMKTSNGIYTNALYTFIVMMNKITTIEGITHLFVAFDKGKKTLRHQEYDDYKGTRKKMPEELAMQIPFIKEYLDIANIKRLELDDYEADDIVGTMSERFKDDFDEIIVISSDRDLLQLVKDNVSVWLNRKGLTDLEIYTKDNFYDKMNFHANQLIDYKGLVGDNSDNLPGIPGIGPKTAIKLLNEYQTLENIIDNALNLSKSQQTQILENKDLAMRTKHLATIYLDARFDLDIEEAKYQSPIGSKLRPFFEKFEFQSFINRLPVEEEREEKVNLDVKYYQNELNLEWIKKQEIIGFELELSEENYHQASIVGFSITSQNTGYYFDKIMLNNEVIIKLLEDKNVKKVCLDSKRVIVSLEKEGIKIRGIIFDLLLASYAYDPSLGTKDYQTIFSTFIQTNLPYQVDVYGKKNPYQFISDELLVKYSIDKCIYTLLAYPLILTKLKEIDALVVFEKMELPLAKVLARVEQNGFMIDRNRLMELGNFFEEKLHALEQEIYEIAGHEFNISSPKQLGIIIFEEMMLAKGKKNKTGYSTSADILEKLAKKHPFPAKILEYRKYSKLMSTYVNGLADAINPLTKKIHTTFKQSLTLTGRLSSVEPNIQNIPVRTEEGRLIRSIFIPSFANGYLVSADYSQIELRVLASLSKCQTMIDEFNEGHDFHATTASRIYGVSLEEVTKDMRRVAKAVNFGIIYGMSDWGLAEQLSIPQYQASLFIKRYFEAYPEIKDFMDDVVKKAIEDGYTKTLFNRRRYIPEITSSNHALREFGKRTAMNAPIQGTAADIMKYAMISVLNNFEKLGLKSKIVAQVHDELIIDCSVEELEIVKETLKTSLENAIDINIKLEADIEIGKNWDLK